MNSSKLFSIVALLFLTSLFTGCQSSNNSSGNTVNNKGGLGASNGDYTFTLWVETNNPPDTTYYDLLATMLASNSNLSFNKAIVRINGDGAASGGAWYDSMNPAGNNNNPVILELLRKLQGTDIALYALPYLSKASDELWDIYSGQIDDAPALVSWWSSLGVSNSTYAGSLKQAVRWVNDINTLATSLGITKTFTGIVFEPEGAPYPNDERTLQAIATYKQTYGIPSLKVGMTGAPSQGAAYVGYAADGVLDEGYLQMYNLTDNPSQDPNNTYIDAMASGASITGNAYPAFPNSIYTQAWLNNPSTAGQSIWPTDPKLWSSGENMGFQHSHNPAVNIGLLNFDFYNNGNGYTYANGCAAGSHQCAKLYFMFSTECGDDAGNVPAGIQCNCLFPGCPQSQINAFGTWSSATGLSEFLQFLDIANVDWQMPMDQFAIFQYQLLPANWVNQ